MNKFFLEIITPERTFYSGRVESITVSAVGGLCTIMAMHQPTVLATEPGILKITADGKTREAFISEGFIEVRPDETVVFSQAVEWPEEINLPACRNGQCVRLRSFRTIKTTHRALRRKRERRDIN